MKKINLLAIDSGDVKSAYIIYNSEKNKIIEKNILPNDEFLEAIIRAGSENLFSEVAIEKLHSMGMAVGQTTFDTIFMNGRIYQAMRDHLNLIPTLYPRHDIKMHLCMTTRAKDGNIRMALVNRFGDPSTKKNPHDKFNELTDGIYFGTHFWSCLAVAMYHLEPHHSKPVILDSYGTVQNKFEYPKGTVN